MKTLKRLLCTVILCPIFWSSAQLSQPFHLLDTALLETRYFINQSPGFINLNNRDGADTTVNSSTVGKQLYLEVTRSQFNGVSLPPISELRNSVREFSRAENSMPLIILDLEYNCLLPYALDSGLVDTLGGEFTHVPESGSPFEKKHLFSSFFLSADLPEGLGSIYLGSEFYFGDSIPDSLDVQFNQFPIQRIALNSHVEIPSFFGDLHFKIYTTHNNPKKAKAFLPAGNCNAPYFPDTSPWDMIDIFNPWKIKADFQDVPVYANAYIKYRIDPQSEFLEKPFIFVEGIDFNNMDHTPLRNGDFGWCQFAGGNDPQYDFLYNAPNLIEELRANGYDIILLDFEDGAEYIEKNSPLLRKLINLVNEHKSGNEPNIISGASMGGLISRRVLKEMEDNGEYHCSRLWISLDSPHQGATVPIGLQKLLEFLGDDENPQNAMAEEKLNTTLRRPAARQMLIDQADPQTSLFDEYYSEMNALGYPQECRKVGIANGSVYGISQVYEASDPLIDFYVNSFFTPDVWMQVYAAPGSPFIWNPTIFRVFTAQVPTAFFQLPLGLSCIPLDFINDACIGNVNSYYPYEVLPGGTRKSIQELVFEINEVLNDGECNSGNNITNYQVSHGFIPSYSALGIAFEEVGPGHNIDDQVENLNIPFDFFSGGNINEQHSEITNVTLEKVLDQVLAGENLHGDELDISSLNNGVFNFGKEGNDVIRNLRINEGGQLLINNLLAYHFAELLDGPVIDSHFTLRTSGCGSIIENNDGGLIHVGDQNNLSSATFRIDFGSTLILNEGSEVHIWSNSQLKIQRADLELNGGKIFIHDGGELILEEEGEFSCSISSDIVLENGNSIIRWSSNGQISSGAVLKVEQDMGGEVIVESDCAVELFGNGELFIKGVSSGVDFLRINDDKQFTCFGENGTLRIRNANINLESNSELNCSSTLFMRQSELQSTQTDPGHLAIRNDNVIYNCRFIQCPIQVDLTAYPSEILNIDLSYFSGTQSAINIIQGGYSISNSEFASSGTIRCFNRSEEAFISQCQFYRPAIQIPNPVYNASSSFVIDDGYSPLHVSGCSFNYSKGSALLKAFGSVYLLCSEFIGNHFGLDLRLGTTGRMDFLAGMGNNYFNMNRENIHLEEAGGLELKGGKNKLYPFDGLSIVGTMEVSCDCFGEILFDASMNSWSSEFPQTTSEGLIEVIVPEFCPEDPLWNGCPVNFIDNQPASGHCGEIEEEANKKSLKLKEAVQVYPNPNSGECFFECSEGNIMKIEIYSMLGDLVHITEGIESSSFRLKLPANFPSGTYLASVITSQNQLKLPFVIH